MSRKQNKSFNFSIVGNNAAGLKAKTDSLFHVIKTLNYPSCLTIQETKLPNRGKLAIEGYKIFEKPRSVYGGGLLTAVDTNLEPFEIENTNDDDSEILVVQCQVGGQKIRVLNAYGPQEDDPTETRISFWTAVHQKIFEAKSEGCMLLLQMDANAKLGNEIIKDDCNSMSENGRLMYEIIESESLSVLNSSSLCSGVITRYRETTKGIEMAVLDYVLACDRLATFLDSMLIDEQRVLTLTKYATTKGVKSVVKSDHNILFAKFSLEYKKLNSKKPRQEVFNLKNEACKELFTVATEQNRKLSECFVSGGNFADQCKNFFKTIDGVLYKCFKKVRIGARSIVDKDVGNLLAVESELRQKSLKTEDKEIFEKLSEVEDLISSKISSRNVKLVTEMVKELSCNGKFSQIGMWKLKSKLFPKELDSPMAKYDDKGNLVTTTDALKTLYIEHYRKRLSHREIKCDYQENFDKKVSLWQWRFDHLKSCQTDDWTLTELRNSLKSLKTNKCRDPNGLLNELFKPAVIGSDLEKALLQFVNGVKREYYVPEKMQMANITTIYKKKGSKKLLDNDRGIFTLSIYRKIIDRLVYQEKYPLIDNEMSDSNIGARKDKNIKNHLFIVYAVINDVLRSGKCVDIQVYDLVKAFDVLWLADTLNDMWDTLPENARDNKLGLVYQLSLSNLSNTAVGQTDRFNIPEVVTQGGTWGPLLCSNSIDQIGKYALQNCDLFKYRNVARILPLAMVDDLLAIGSCGVQSNSINTAINTKIELKKLEFHTPTESGKGKCQFMHIGKANKFCLGMKVHGKEVEQVKETLYLGDIIRDDGKNSSNVKNRVRKGFGIVAEITTILKSISFGHKYFEIANVLREARLINGILTNVEVWYSLGNKEIAELENIDKIYLRKVMAAPQSVSTESLYLELGLVPISAIIKQRRVMFLHYLANLKEDELLFKVFIHQWNYPVKGDWTESVRSDLADFGLSFTLDQLKLVSKRSFKKSIKIKTKEFAFKTLLEKKDGHSKMKDLHYNELKLQSYLKDPGISVSEAQDLFKFRTRSANFKENMKSRFFQRICPLCGTHPDSQSYSFECSTIKENINIVGRYEDIFSEKIPASLGKTINEIMQFREKTSTLSLNGTLVHQ